MKRHRVLLSVSSAFSGIIMTHGKFVFRKLNLLLCVGVFQPDKSGSRRLETGGQSIMSNISWPDYGDLFPLVTVVCYIALVTSGLIAILDRPLKPKDYFSRKREPANAKLSTLAPLISRPTALFHLK